MRSSRWRPCPSPRGSRLGARSRDRPGGCRITSAESDLYGLRPRLATFTAMRPPGSSTLQHSAKTSRASRGTRDSWPESRVSPSSASYSLPAKYGGEVTTRAMQRSGKHVDLAAVRADQLVLDGTLLDRVVAFDQARGLEPVVEARSVVTPRASRLRTTRSVSATRRAAPSRFGHHLSPSGRLPFLAGDPG